MADVSFRNVSKTYPGGIAAVRGLSLDIPDGQFVVLVGPSGCGKTTSLRVLAGLEDAEQGSVWIGGREVTRLHPKDRDVAMVFQNYALYPHMTVYKNMAFALTLRSVKRSEIERRVRDAARTLGIEDLLDRKPRQLSGGQRQRVALGRAIVREPKAFLFDEPLSNLDARLRVTTRAELKALHQRLRTTTVYVTHDQEEAMTLGDRIVVMCKGEVQQDGPPLEVYQRPANRFVASFIGTPPMNLVPGNLAAADRGLTFEAERGGMRLPVAARHASGLKATGSRVPVVLGLRPSAIRDPGGPPSEVPIKADIQVVEPLGDFIDLSLSVSGVPLVARIPARSGLSSGQSAGLSVDMAAAHYFEPGDFGRNLLL